MEEAVREAAAYCVGRGVLERELSNLATEVLNMLAAEFNMAGLDKTRSSW